MAIYAFTISQIMLVEAADEDSAHQVAEENISELDWQEYQAEFDGEITSQGDLARTGWDEGCIPYGGDGNTRLKEILPEGQS